MRVLVSCAALFGAVAADLAVGDTAVSIVPVADAFVREQDPTSNFGGGGGLSVGGPNSVNGGGSFRGRFDTVMRYDAAPLVAEFDSVFGVGQWTISSVTLSLSEFGAPTSLLFPRGLGTYAVSWLSADAWSEGSGTPAAPEPGSGDVVTWNLLQALVASGSESLLGGGANTQTNMTYTIPLATDAAFLADIAAGDAVTLHLSPTSDAIGFTFRARDHSATELRPILTLTAVPEPASAALLLSALALRSAARRR